MPTNKGEKMKHHTPEEKAALVQMICELYESQNATIESCCEASGISEPTFRLWMSQNTEFKERYKKAKEVQEDNYWEDIIKPLQKRALQKHLEAQTMEDESEVVYQGVKAKDPDSGEPVWQKSKKEVLPNPSVLIFSMKGTYPDKFSDKQEVKHSGAINTGFDVSKLTDREAAALLQLMEKAKNE